MQVVSATEAEFRDPAGHVVLFRLRPQAVAFQRPCLDQRAKIMFAMKSLA